MSPSEKHPKCVQSVLWSRDPNSATFKGIDAHRSILSSAVGFFLQLMSAGRVNLSPLGQTGRSFADMVVDAGEISVRVLGTTSIQVAVIVHPKGADSAIEGSRKSFVRTLRRQLEAETKAEGGAQ